jgi:hypothetical protein
VGSFSTVHLGFPCPVIVAIQPAGVLPMGLVSNVTLSAMAVPPMANDVIITMIALIMELASVEPQ